MRFPDDSAETAAHCQDSPMFPRPYVLQINMVGNGTMTKGPKFPGPSVPKV